MTARTLALKYLPAPAVRRLRGVKSYLATCFFRPYEARHSYAGFDLTVHITDRTGRLWYDHDWEELPEHTLLRKHRLKPGAKVFELGAHQAVVALMVSRMVGESGQIVALEPGEHNFETAVKNKETNAAHNLTMLCAAATDRSGEITFSDTMNGRIGPGILRPSYSVDDLARKFGAPDIVKIDVEGYEAKVLSGAATTLAAKPDWYVEVHCGLGLEDNGGSAEQIVDLFRNAGYQLYVQDDIHYHSPFRPLDVIPQRWFQMVAIAT